MQIICASCPRKCNAVRTVNENIGGFCAMPLFPVVARAALHFWEEPCISGKNGSGTVFFSGCNLGCVFCQNFEISHFRHGKTISIERLAEIFRELEQAGAHNINFVNPTHELWAIKKALEIYRPKIPLVYNTSGYDLPEIIHEDLFDIYLFDLKYLHSEPGRKYSGAADYSEYATSAIKEAYRLKPQAVFDESGLMQSGLIVRHLILPLATREALSVTDWFSENTPDAVFSLMAQYTPHGKIEAFPELQRSITKREYNKVADYAINKGIRHLYLQECSSAKKEYIPSFDGQGV